MFRKGKGKNKSERNTTNTKRRKKITVQLSRKKGGSKIRSVFLKSRKNEKKNISSGINVEKKSFCGCAFFFFLHERSKKRQSRVRADYDVFKSHKIVSVYCLGVFDVIGRCSNTRKITNRIAFTFCHYFLSLKLPFYFLQ